MTRACSHRRCPDDACRALTPEQLEPSAEDLELAHRLIADGWYSVSSKYREVMRWREPVPMAQELMTDAAIHTPHGQHMIELWNRHGRSSFRLRTAPDELTERRALTVRQFHAFKKLGGETA